MDVVIARSSALRGILHLPADKAICHRALLVASLAPAAIEITPWATGEDCRRTLEVVQGLGVPVAQAGAGVRIQGVGLAGWRAPAGPLFCGDSGTTMRLIAGALAGPAFRPELTAGPRSAIKPGGRIR